VISQKITKEIEDVLRALKAEFENNFLALILYGSWAKGKAREDSDIDLLAIFKRVDKDVTKAVNEIFSDIEVRHERSITVYFEYFSPDENYPLWFLLDEIQNMSDWERSIRALIHRRI